MTDNTKPTNPKDMVGVARVPFDIVPSEVTGEVALALLEGALKYGAYNWRVDGVLCSVYLGAARRHMEDFKNGVDIDPDSGVHHISKAIASLTVLRDSMLQGNWRDDRPPKGPPGMLQRLNELAAKLIAKYPNPKRPYTELEYPSHTIPGSKAYWRYEDAKTDD